jgi:hypothetical protein
MKFKVGDKVRVIDNGLGQGNIRIGTIDIVYKNDARWNNKGCVILKSTPYKWEEYQLELVEDTLEDRIIALERQITVLSNIVFNKPAHLIDLENRRDINWLSDGMQ